MKIPNQISILSGLVLATMLASAANASHWRPSWVFQAENVQVHPNAPDAMDTSPRGAATLKRTRYGFTGQIMAQVLTAGDAYTVWIVIFNNSDACFSHPCSAADLGNADARSAVFNGAGAISASDGNGGGVINAEFSAVAGKIPDGMCCRGSLDRRNGLRAEVHIVVDQHPETPDAPDESFWTTHLTTPFGGHRFAIFLPVD